MKVTCEIVEDLFPLYADNLCTAKSRQAVEEHLQECEKCRHAFDSTQAVTIPIIEPDRPAADKAVKKGFKKIRIRWWAAILTIIALIPIAFLGWNEYSAQGASLSNIDELSQGNAFMTCLVSGDYEKAYSYIDLDAKKYEWLEDWFEEKDLLNMEADGLKKFCELGEKLEALGGIESYEYVGIMKSYAVDHRGDKVYQIIYRIKFQGQAQEFRVDVSPKGIHNFSGTGSFIDDPLAQFCIWSEYLWQDYKGCYYDPETKQYVYYDKEQ